MASWTTPTTHTTGDTLAVTDWNAVANNETFLYQAPYAIYYDSAGTTLASSALTQVQLGGTVASGYGFSKSSNNAVVPIAGTYYASWLVTIDANAPGSGDDSMYAQIKQNSTVVLSSTTTIVTQPFPGAGGSGLMSCAASDAIGLFCLAQTSGNQPTFANATQTYLHLLFVGST